MERRRAQNLKVLGGLAAILAVMVTLVCYSVPLYRLFCQATGVGGLTQRVDADISGITERRITVRFDTAVQPDLPWRFAPVEPSVTLRLGEEKLVYFTAENLGDEPIVGHATFNVTPIKTGRYFNKIQCFCFTEERLDGHAKVTMPVDFYVDPALASDPATSEVETITLAYTFFRSAKPDGAEDLERFVATTPDPARGATLFAERCSACHALDHNGVGPSLAGIVGRHAAAAAGFRYSPALAASSITWSRDTLDTWLADPPALVPGTRMPIKVLDPGTRRDLIAYLAANSPPAGAAGSPAGGTLAAGAAKATPR